MASVDTKEYLANGGYLRKAASGNLREADQGRKFMICFPRGMNPETQQFIARRQRDILIQVSDGIMMKRYSNLKGERFSRG